MKNLFTLVILLITANTAFAQTSPENYYKNQGQEFLNKKNYKEAVESFAKCVEKNKNSDECYVGRGKAYLELKQEDYARANFKIALRINPQNKEAAENYKEYKSPYNTPTITREGVDQMKKITPEMRRDLDNVTKAQNEMQKAAKEYQEKL